MNRRPWFKCYPGDYLNGIADLTPYEGHLYNTILLRIYDEDGPIPHNIKQLARRCNMRAPACERALNSLLAAGKLYSDGEWIGNNRAELEMSLRDRNDVNTSQTRRKYDVNTSRKKRVASEKANEINKTSPKQGCTRARTISQKLERKKEYPPPLGVPPAKKTKPKGTSLAQKKRGSRIKSDWRPDKRTREKCETLTDRQFVADQIERFVNHWIDATGKNAIKRAWDRAFVNWIKNAVEWGNYNQTGVRTGKRAAQRPSVDDGIAAILGENDDRDNALWTADEDQGPIVEG